MIAYTPEGGQLNTRLQQTDRALLIIEDNGPGISQQGRARVMQRLYRTENHQLSGCGIGLSIVDRVMRIHHGELKLERADSGQGLEVIYEDLKRESVRFAAVIQACIGLPGYIII